MTILSKKIRELTEPGKLIALVEFYDSTTSEVYATKRISFKDKTDMEKEWDKRMEHVIGNVQDMLDEADVQNEFTRDEIEDLLKEKELIAADEKLEDLKSKDDLTAEAKP